MRRRAVATWRPNCPRWRRALKRRYATKYGCLPRRCYPCHSAPRTRKFVRCGQTFEDRKHSLSFPITAARAFGSGASSAPTRDWAANRLQPDPSEGLVQLCKDVPAAVGLLFGIPVVLTSGSGSETQTREAFRRFVASTIQPLALLTAEALTAALSAPVALNLRALRAYDTQGQARSVGALVKAGIDVDEALRTVGLDE